MIRAATPADARQIAEIEHRARWRAYTDIVDPALLAEETVDERAVALADRLAAGEATTLVAEVDGQVRGFATFGRSRLGDGGEIWAMYVDPPAQGAGVGRALLVAAEDALRAAGYASAVLSVLERNGHARHFYEGHGWSHDGEPAVARHWAPELHYRREL